MGPLTHSSSGINEANSREYMVKRRNPHPEEENPSFSTSTGELIPMSIIFKKDEKLTHIDTGHDWRATSIHRAHFSGG